MECRHVRHSSPVDEAIDDFPNAYLPYLWAPLGDGIGGGAVEDPTCIYFGLSFSGENETYWVTSVSELVDDFICAIAVSGIEPRLVIADADSQQSARNLAEQFRELAARLDAACARATTS